MSPEDEQIRDVYAHFGLTSYMAQVLETQLINHLAALKLERTPRKERLDADSVMGELVRQPFGTNVGALRDLLGDESAIAAELGEAVTVRNVLAHHFWRRNMLRMGTTEGRTGLIAELSGHVELFSGLDERLTELTFEIYDRIGVSREWIDRQFEILSEVARGGELPPDLDLNMY